MKQNSEGMAQLCVWKDEYEFKNSAGNVPYFNVARVCCPKLINLCKCAHTVGGDEDVDFVVRSCMDVCALST